MEIHAVGAVLIQAVRKTDGHEEANRCFLWLCEHA